MTAGRHVTDESGLAYYGLRYYDPGKGRFINRDPIGESGGMNLYQFVNNDPVQGVDVWGLKQVFDPNCGDFLTTCQYLEEGGGYGYLPEWRCTNTGVREGCWIEVPDDTDVPGDPSPDNGGSGGNRNNPDQKDNSERCAELTKQIASQAGLRNLIDGDIAGFEGREPTELSLFTGASVGALTTGVAFEALNQLDILPAQATYSFIDAGSRGLGPITELTGYGKIAIGISGVGIGIDALSTGNSLINGDYSGAARSAVSGTVGTFVLRSALKEALTKGAGSSVFTPLVGVATGLASFGGDLVIYNEQKKINQSAFELASKINGIQLKQRAKLDQSITSATKEFNELGCGD